MMFPSHDHVGDGLQRRDFTHVEDVVQANCLAAILSNKAGVKQIINVGTGKNHSVLELAKLIDHKYEFIAPRLGEAQVTLANVEKLKSVFNWQPVNRLERYVLENR